MDELVDSFLAEHPEIPDSAIKWIEKFADYQEANNAVGKVALDAGIESLQLIIDTITATRVGMDSRGPFEEAWMNKAESERLKSVFFSYFSSIFGEKIPHNPHGN